MITIGSHGQKCTLNMAKENHELANRMNSQKYFVSSIKGEFCSIRHTLPKV